MLGRGRTGTKDGHLGCFDLDHLCTAGLGNACAGSARQRILLRADACASECGHRWRMGAAGVITCGCVVVEVEQVRN